MRNRLFSTALLALVTVAALPLRSDGGTTNACFLGAGSLSSTVNEPVAGDEAFFKLPTGPANVMLLLDTSGSMNNLPQCGDDTWSTTSSATNKYCSSPAIAAPTIAAGKYQAVAGTCTPSTLKSQLAWMEAVVPQTTYADPGHSNTLLTDKAPWGNGCTGDNCLFDPNAYYFPDQWAGGTNSTTATRYAHDTDATFAAKGCTLQVTTGGTYTKTPIKDDAGKVIDLGDACRTCMASHGFYFYSAAYKDSSNTTRTVTNGLQFKGTFLNASPPKFATARKVLKDLAYMDDTTPSKLDQVRFGLSILDSGASGKQRAQLIVPLGPDKTTAFPPTQLGFRQARQAILSVVNTDQTIYKDTLGNVILDGTKITGGFFDPVNSSTPLASALFNVGQYFSTPGLWTSLFGSAYELTSFKETSSGKMTAPWVTAAGAQPCSICWACQLNSIIVVTDGSPNSEFTFPSLIPTYDSSGYNASVNCGVKSPPNPFDPADTTQYYCKSPSDGNASLMPRVSDWLHNTDLRTEMSIGTNVKQSITVHTVGFNITQPGAYNILQATATISGGTFQNAKNSKDLADAVFNAVYAVLQKENSFSAASANSLQTVQTASSEAFLTRFKPNQTNTWEGHVFEGALFDEFLNGCDRTKPPSAQPTVSCGGKTVSSSLHGDTDASGNATCAGVFLIDADCDEVAEDSTSGDFVKKGQATAANLPWDAGATLSTPTKTGYRSADEGAANARTIFTWLNGSKVYLTAANVATLKPYLNIDATWCTALLTQIGVSGGSDPTTECARQVIYFVRGFDVLNNDLDGCWGPNNPKNTASCPSKLNGEERDRVNDARTTGKVFWKLGDVFHSSPAVVTAPIDEFRCDTGYEKQCVATLHSPGSLPSQTKIATGYAGLTSATVDAYERYRLDNRTRRRVVLVGANDGMLHAFDAGLPDTSKTVDPITGVYPYLPGAGEELWAFIPPDLLPRLKDLLAQHQYMVDGSVMVRDVWVDANGDATKQNNEFHTVAVFGERSGGTQYSALDVTNPTSPTLLWSFPLAGSSDARYMGQSWSDFAPRPPPIGPVRLVSAKDSRGYEERWMVMINGGYDPTLALGRAVFMLDIWSGQTLWRFTDDDFKSAMGYGSGTSMFPVPAGIALMDVGDTSAPNLDSDGYFDTATWGDMGGNLWVARFWDPGVIGSNGMVNNWYAARTFEEQRRTDDLQGVTDRSEFFYMTSNAYEPTSRTLHTYLGSGNRERMMDQGATCGTDNLMGCCRAGCTLVKGTTTEDYGACNATSQFLCQSGFYQRAATSSTAVCGSSVSCGAAPGNKYAETSTVHWECPGFGAIADATGSATCDSSGNCSVSPIGTRTYTNSSWTDPPHNRFYGVWAYGRDAKKAFRTAAEAKLFDQNRFTDGSYTGSCTGPSGSTCALVNVTPAVTTSSSSTCSGGATTCRATVNDAGWFYEYGRQCPLKNCNPAPPWTDEKTGSSATVVLGCAAWGGFRPVGSSSSIDPCTGSFGTPVTYGYVANFVSGVPTASCGYPDSSGAIYRSSLRNTTAPPTAATVRVTFSPSGQVSYSALSMDAGAPPSAKQLGTRTELSEPVYWLEVPRQLHACRHADSTTCQ